MASSLTQLPCDCDGICLACKVKPQEAEKLTCKTCVTQWHVLCVSSLPASMEDTVRWECPDCSSLSSDIPLSIVKTSQDEGGSLISAIRAIEADDSLTDTERAKKRQRLLSGKAVLEEDKNGECEESDILKILNGTLSCSFCLQLLERPVTVTSNSLQYICTSRASTNISNCYLIIWLYRGLTA